LPVYSEAINYRMLVTELGAAPGTGGQVARRSPFAFMFRYLAGQREPLDWPAIERVDGYLLGPADAELGLPRKLAVRYLATDNLKLFPAAGSGYADIRVPLGWVSFGAISNLEPHIVLLEGRLPEPASGTPGEPVEVLVSEAMATRLGLRPGEAYIAFDANQSLQRANEFLEVPVRVAGIWAPADPQEAFWFYGPSALAEVLLVPTASLQNALGTSADRPIYTALWYLVTDGSGLRTSDVEGLLGRIAGVRQRASELLPGISLDASPVEALMTYRLRTAWLSVLLYAFSIPVVGLVLAFIAMVSGLAVERQRGEIAVFRSRGASMIQVFSITLAEGLLLGTIALATGLPAGEWLAGLIGRTRGFLDFGGETSLRVTLTSAACRLGVGMLAVAVLAQAAPAIGAARRTVVSARQERARRLQPPWWQRAWLDALLLVPAGYGAYVLRRQGAIVPSVVSSGVAAWADNLLPSDPFENPLLLLVPALTALALTLVVLRLLPWIMAAVAWLAGHTASVGVVLTARHLARTQGYYAAPLMLLILTLSLSTYTATLAQTLDRHTYDRSYYEVGADVCLVESGYQTARSGLVLSGLPGMGGSSSATSEAEEPSWEALLPVEEHLRAPGVVAATPVGRYPASIYLGGSKPTGVLLGIDRTGFPQVAYWRHDFSPASLGALMNALALADDGVLVSRQSMAEYGLQVGDRLRVDTIVLGRECELNVKVVGSVEYFPSWYPSHGPLLVGNLEYLFERSGGYAPYDVWLRTAPNHSVDHVAAGVRDLGFQVSSVADATAQVRRELRRPERQGLFGLLSVGFGAAALLTVLGFLFYALFSFQRRSIELGVLRAIGLSAGQMVRALAAELALLLLTGLAAGTAIGVWISRLFIPHLQVGSKPAELIPPYLVTIGWPTIVRIYALQGLMFLVTLALLTAMLSHMRIFEAIKLGEAD
ncbi:MAG: ABC transporter permease, partial [Anaerolineae bacterium]|nr:ABC transporter permease [Anaerolineae bacterium]